MATLLCLSKKMLTLIKIKILLCFSYLCNYVSNLIYFILTLIQQNSNTPQASTEICLVCSSNLIFSQEYLLTKAYIILQLMTISVSIGLTVGYMLHSYMHPNKNLPVNRTPKKKKKKKKNQ